MTKKEELQKKLLSRRLAESNLAIPREIARYSINYQIALWTAEIFESIEDYSLAKKYSLDGLFFVEQLFHVVSAGGVLKDERSHAFLADITALLCKIYHYCCILGDESNFQNPFQTIEKYHTFLTRIPKQTCDSSVDLTKAFQSAHHAYHGYKQALDGFKKNIKPAVEVQTSRKLNDEEKAWLKNISQLFSDAVEGFNLVGKEIENDTKLALAKNVEQTYQTLIASVEQYQNNASDGLPKLPARSIDILSRLKEDSNVLQALISTYEQAKHQSELNQSKILSECHNQPNPTKRKKKRKKKKSAAEKSKNQPNRQAEPSKKKETPASHYEKGNQFLNDGDYAKAREQYQFAIRAANQLKKDEHSGLSIYYFAIAQTYIDELENIYELKSAERIIFLHEQIIEALTFGLAQCHSESETYRDYSLYLASRQLDFATFFIYGDRQRFNTLLSEVEELQKTLGDPLLSAKLKVIRSDFQLLLAHEQENAMDPRYKRNHSELYNKAVLQQSLQHCEQAKNGIESAITDLKDTASDHLGRWSQFKPILEHNLFVKRCLKEKIKNLEGKIQGNAKSAQDKVDQYEELKLEAWWRKNPNIKYTGPSLLTQYTKTLQDALPEFVKQTEEVSQLKQGMSASKNKI